MAEYIILDISEKEEAILEKNNIDFLIDDLHGNNRDINVTCSKGEFEDILKLIGRTSSYS